MRATIKDVAKLAGVSPSTVTRVIQNSSAISQKTKDSVRKAMAELNYHPNLNARSLVSSYTQVIGLVLPDDSDIFYQNPFFPTALRGISQVAADHNYAIQISTGKDEKQRLEAISQMVYGRRVDGLIFLYSKPDDPLVQLAIQHNFPFLILGKAASPFISLVDNDNIQAAFEATSYFIQKGYKNLAFVAGNKELVVSQDRYKGYKKALKAYHIPLDDSKVKFSSGFLLEDSSYKVMKKLMKQKPDAIVTTDTMVAEGILHYLNEVNARLPIISFDSVKPKLAIDAYVDVHAIQLGRVACDTLLQIINDSKEDKQICYRRVIQHTITEL
ncbi:MULTISPECIES: LacI family DNA-binding transcriptional regulator [unclassified Streptococcus]|uniref:LacI family DNA-binding transcriptional regulator n=1 Tax=unclassified Streptococcus TaxID=2608887 RepID=UPI001072041F|nr:MULTISPECIES: LacI family DNA-binding transcriptional regulator [unclassified Streptococcus]MBF0787532.1 LacI family DNA-binding transcriptional regulator [Streptococcus sp. 19428wC2_LYSM12]MCQ9211443.1 LacI family DNA-binding transcriptional regulator [Streptococcus sp. B01]MCQ9214758.1 LacI family DNA-binding transcriptional regulator [Streptococcus sp. O1]TFV05483.1 LacI family transcriptional regulator [Streptococcus sp. LYSM12]